MGDALEDRLRQAVADRARVEELELAALEARGADEDRERLIGDLRAQLAAATKRAKDTEQALLDALLTSEHIRDAKLTIARAERDAAQREAAELRTTIAKRESYSGLLERKGAERRAILEKYRESLEALCDAVKATTDACSGAAFGDTLTIVGERRLCDLDEALNAARAALAAAGAGEDYAARFARLPPVQCKCGLQPIPRGVDIVSWYWQEHGRERCVLLLPNERCECGLLRSEHVAGHADAAGAGEAGK